jgi:hypothetical protein
MGPKGFTGGFAKRYVLQRYGLGIWVSDKGGNTLGQSNTRRS